jgi:hypothetical protein
MIGNFQKSKINGTAVLNFPNKNIYVGKWKKGKLIGKCIKYTTSKNYWSLLAYKNGKCIKKELDL